MPKWFIREPGDFYAQGPVPCEADSADDVRQQLGLDSDVEVWLADTNYPASLTTPDQMSYFRDM